MTSIDKKAYKEYRTQICILKNDELRKEFFEEMKQESPTLDCDVCNGYDTRCSDYEIKK